MDKGYLVFSTRWKASVALVGGWFVLPPGLMAGGGKE